LDNEEIEDSKKDRLKKHEEIEEWIRKKRGLK